MWPLENKYEKRKIERNEQTVLPGHEDLGTQVCPTFISQFSVKPSHSTSVKYTQKVMINMN